MPASDPANRVAVVRRFNRFYTKQIGVVQEHLLQTPFSLTEARLIYELAQAPQTTATRLGEALELDAGYVSRTLQSFKRRGLIARARAAHDGRQSLLSLTEKGRAAFQQLNAASAEQIATLLSGHTEEEQKQLVQAMETIERLLGGGVEDRVPYILRPPHAGDLGWVVESHGRLYAAEYGWDERFEGLVAEIIGQFAQQHDPRRERCWIAERHGENVGSVFVVARTKTIAQLRLLLVEPKARGFGIGAHLVNECIEFSRRVGYKTLTLWTNDVLHSARRIYEAAGFELVSEEPHDRFGQDLVGQTWDLTL